MWSTPGVFTLPDLEDAIRFVLLIVDIVGISLSFIGLRAAYIVLGVIFAISIIFNVLITLARSHETRLKAKNGQPICPNIAALSLEIVGAVTFLILFIIATTDTLAGDNYWAYNSISMTYVHAYAGMSGLVASILHAFLAAKRSAQYLAYRRSFDNRCPHCHRTFGNNCNQTPSSQISPLALESQEPVVPRQSFSANSVGETENDNLIMKE